MAELKINTEIELVNSNEKIRVIRKLGEGGQGYVYMVELGGKRYALKWYKKGAIKDIEYFKKNLQNNISEKAPTDAFLWPLAMTQTYGGTFGYIMELRPEGYYEFSDFLTNRVEFANIENMLIAAIKIVDSFRTLHNNGFSYQDLNDGNFFINPQNGDVLICDNDNVSQFGEKSGIAGKCRYMAPSVVIGKKTPDKRTDQFSLAVVLFLLILRNHPLEGETIHSKAVMTEQRQKRYYGEAPVFIADPNNATNRPVKGIHNNFITRWPQMPDYIKKAFIKSFSHEVMCDDKMGVSEKEWLQLLLSFQAEVVVCPECGRETRYYKENMPCICCKKPIKNFGWLKTSTYRLPIVSRKNICEAYITDRYDQNESSKVIAAISINKTRTKASLQNRENVVWKLGASEIKPEERILLQKGSSFNIHGEKIIIE